MISCSLRLGGLGAEWFAAAEARRRRAGVYNKADPSAKANQGVGQASRKRGQAGKGDATRIIRISQIVLYELRPLFLIHVDRVVHVPVGIGLLGDSAQPVHLVGGHQVQAAAGRRCPPRG
jgi:hypothetical protein